MMTPQGILTAFLVTCNCRVLKLYTAPRHKQQQQKYAMKNGCYKSLRDCEKGQYGVLSITNPNYDASAEDDQGQQREAGLSDDEDVDLFKSDSLGVQHPLKVWRSSQEMICEDGAGSSSSHIGVSSHCQVAQNVERSNSQHGNLAGTGNDTFLASGSDCDKSFRGDGNAEVVDDFVEDRILTPRTTKSGEDDSGARAGDSARGGNNKKSIQTLPPSHGKLSGALRITELARRPLPSAV